MGFKQNLKNALKNTLFITQKIIKEFLDFKGTFNFYKSLFKFIFHSIIFRLKRKFYFDLLFGKRHRFKYHEDYFGRYACQEETIKYGKDSPIKAFYNLDKDYLTKADTEILDKDEWVDYILNGGKDEFLITSACGVRILLNNGFFIKGIYEMGFLPYNIVKRIHNISKITTTKTEFDEYLKKLLFDTEKTYYDSFCMGWYIVQLSKSKPKVLDIGICKVLDDLSQYSNFFEVQYGDILEAIAIASMNKKRKRKSLEDIKRDSSKISNDIKSSKKYQEEMAHKFLQMIFDTFEIYTKTIEAFINRKVNNAINSNIMEIKQITLNDEFNDIYYPRYFSDNAIKMKKLFEGENFIELDSVANFLKRITPDEMPSDCRIVFKFNHIAEEDISLEKDSTILVKSNFYIGPLQKGDIVIKAQGLNKYSARLIDEVVGLVYADVNMFILTRDISTVIRPFNISPEYLCLYLNSELGQMAMECDGLDDKTPILPPKKDNAYYKDMFKTIILNERRYTQIAQSPKEQELTQSIIKAKNKGEFGDNFIHELLAKGESLNDINEAGLRADDIMLHDAQLKNFIENDINELNTCFKNGAYKATLALAGSILEVFLIDWLSEIHGRDYFNETYRPPGKSSAVLVDYIEAIKEIKKPEWMQEADKAHSIREKRNLLHAKLCLKSDEINEKVCNDVIKYLVQIIETRNIK